VKDSNYRYLEGKINKAWEELEGDAMSPNVYAKQVVSKVVKTKRYGVELVQPQLG
jgi:1-acylglycerone phosphate reductase